MEKTINKKMILRLTTFILITTLLIPLSTHLLNEKINEKNQQQETNIDLDVSVGNPSARFDVDPNVAIRDRHVIKVNGTLKVGAFPIPNERVYALWNLTRPFTEADAIDYDDTDSNGYFEILLQPAETMNAPAGNIFGNVNVTAWYPGSQYYGESWANETIEVYATSNMAITLSSQTVNQGGTFDAYLTLSYDNNTRLAGANAYLRLWNGTEYGPQITDSWGQTTFTINVSNTEPLNLDQPVRGAADVSTIPGVSPYLLGSNGIIGDTWANKTALIDIQKIAIITFDVSADPNIGNLPNPPIPPDIPEAYRGSYYVCLNGTFTDDDGQPVVNELVQAAIDGQAVTGASTFTGVGGYFEIFFLLPTTTAVKNVNMTVLEYNGTIISTSDEKPLRVLASTYLNNVDKDLDFYYRGEILYVYGNLYDDQDNPVTSEFVSAFLTNQSIGYFSPTYDALTDGSGYFSIGVDTSSVPAGNRSCYLNVTFYGAPPHYDPSTLGFLITVNFFASSDFTEILLGGFSIGTISTLQKSNDYDVEARLMDEFGRSITGRTVEVFWDGNSILSTGTDASGKVYTSLTTSDYSADLLPLVFSFSYLGGSQQYIETYDFFLDNTAPSIDSFNADPEEVELGESCTISVSGTDDGPLSNVTLVLTDPDGNVTRVTQQVTTSLNFDVQFVIDTSQSEYNIVGNWTFYLVVIDREGESRISAQGQFTVIEKEGTDLGDLTLIAAIISANVLAAISGYFIAGKIRAQGGLGPFLQNLKDKLKK